MRRRALPLVLVLALLVAACSGDGDGDAAPTTPGADASSTSTSTTVAEETTTTATTEPERITGFRATVEALAADDVEGRDNGTPGSELAQQFLVEQLDGLADPVPGGDGYRHAFADGTNVLGVIPGSELPDEYVVLGAHYDHIGHDCRSTEVDDDVCNGAGDNAAGVAAVLEIGRRLVADGPPRRSVVLAFWDAEEDGLRGANAYVGAPPVPLEQTVAYLNWDIQGVNLAPTLTRLTILVGAETGGEELVAAAQAATGAGDLDPVLLSLVFGQGRSDHAVFVAAGVPVTFFTDANNGCYHSAQDEIERLDFDKLAEEISIGEALARELVTTDTPPVFVAGAPVATFEDAESMLAVVRSSEADFGRFPPEGEAVVEQYLADLTAMVDAGPDAFADDDLGTLLGGAAAVVDLLARSECDGFLG